MVHEKYLLIPTYKYIIHQLNEVTVLAFRVTKIAFVLDMSESAYIQRTPQNHRNRLVKINTYSLKVISMDIYRMTNASVNSREKPVFVKKKSAKFIIF